MKKGIIAISLMLIIFIIPSCGGDSGGSEEEKHVIGTAYFAGMEIQFVFDLQKITLINHNNTVTKTRILNLTNQSILVDDYITWPGNTDNKNNLLFNQGDQISIEVWQGPSSVFYGDILGWAPDYSGTATLIEGNIAVTTGANYNSFLVQLPVVLGAVCDISGKYFADLSQDENALFCDNAGSDLLHIELYALTWNGTEYDSLFEIANFWMLWEDMAQLNVDFIIPDPIALKVMSFDPFDNLFINEQVYGCNMDFLNQICAEINDPINLP